MVKLSCGTETFDAQPDAADLLCRLLSCARQLQARAASMQDSGRPQPVMVCCEIPAAWLFEGSGPSCVYL